MNSGFCQFLPVQTVITTFCHRPGRKHFLPSKCQPIIYDHFLNLSIAMSILLHPKYCSKHQIANDVLTFSSLGSCSAITFENFVQQFKKCLRKGDKPLQQLVKRLGEMSNSDSWSSNYHINSPIFSSLHFWGLLLTGCDASKQ